MREGIAPGDRVLLEDHEATQGTVVALTGRSVTVHTDDGGLVALPVNEFFKKIGFNRTTALFPHLASDPELKRAMRLADHIIEVNQGWVHGKPQNPDYDPETTTVSERQALKVAEFKNLDPASGHPDAAFAKVSEKAFQRWRTNYKKGGVGALMDKRKIRRSSSFGDQPQEIVDIVFKLITDRPDGYTPSQTGFYADVRRAIDTYNEDHDTNLELPSESTIKRMVKQLGKGRHVFGDAKTRRSANSSPFGEFVLSHEMRPGDQVQIDSTKFDLLGQTADGSARRFELTLAIDVACRAVLAYTITEYATNGVDAAQMLAKILMPEPMREGWEDNLRFSYESIPFDRVCSFDERFEQAARSPVVFPDTIVIDNGKVFLSHAFLDACQQLGISVYQARPGTGHDKAIVERMFRTINPQFTEHINGYINRSVHLRGKDDPPPEELLTVEELNELFGEYLITWHNKPHSGLRLPHRPDEDLSPNDYFEYAAAAFGYLPRPVSFGEAITLFPAQERTVQSYGVEINNRIYDAAELNPLRNKLNPNHPKDLWTFYADPDVLNSVYFYDEDDDQVLRIPLKGIERANRPFVEKQWQAAFRLATSINVEVRHAQAIDELVKLQDELADGTAQKRANARLKQRQEEHNYPMATPVRLAALDDTDLEEEEENDGYFDEFDDDVYDFVG